MNAFYGPFGDQTLATDSYAFAGGSRRTMTLYRKVMLDARILTWQCTSTFRSDSRSMVATKALKWAQAATVRDGLRPPWKDVGPSDYALAFKRNELYRIFGDALTDKLLHAFQRQGLGHGEIALFPSDDIQALAKALGVR